MKFLECLFGNRGGVGVYVRRLTNELRRQGHQVEVLDIGEDRSPVDAPHHQLPVSYGPLGGLRVRGRLDAVLRRVAPDVVHLHAPFTVMSPLLVRHLRQSLPTLATLHDVRPFCFHGTRRFGPTGAICSRRCGLGCVTSGCSRVKRASDILRILRQLLTESATIREWKQLPRVAVVSGYLRDLALAHGFDPQRIELTPCFTDPPTDRADHSRDDMPLILCLGQLVETKGVFLLLEALHQLRDHPWRARFVGEGPEAEALKRRARAFGIADRVEFTGYLTGDALAQTRREARLLVLPSTIPEGCAQTGIEALFFGVPVVGFALGGETDWLRDGETGLIAADCDAADLAAKIRRLLDDPPLARALGERGFELVDRDYRTDEGVRRIVEICESVIAETRSTGPR